MGRRRGRRVPKFSSKRKILGDRKYRRDRQKTDQASVSHDHSYAQPIRGTKNITYEHRYLNFFLDDESDADFSGNEDTTTSHSPEELLDSDLCSANQFYVVLDKIYEYDPNKDLDSLVSHKQKQRYFTLDEALSSVNVGNFLKTKDHDRIRFVHLYNSDNPGIKTCVTILPNFTADVKVHRISVSKNHRLWSGLPCVYVHASSVVHLLEKIETFTICVGNFDAEYQNLVGVGADIINKNRNGTRGFREQDFGAVAGNAQYSSTIRSKDCDLLVNSRRCWTCNKLRVLVRNRTYKPKGLPCGDISISSSRTHSSMSTDELKTKLVNMRSIKNGLQAQVQRLTKRLEKYTSEDLDYTIEMNSEEEEDEEQDNIPFDNCVQEEKQEYVPFDNCVQEEQANIPFENCVQEEGQANIPFENCVQEVEQEYIPLDMCVHEEEQDYIPSDNCVQSAEIAGLENGLGEHVKYWHESNTPGTLGVAEEEYVEYEDDSSSNPPLRKKIKVEEGSEIHSDSVCYTNVEPQSGHDNVDQNLNIHLSNSYANEDLNNQLFCSSQISVASTSGIITGGTTNIAYSYCLTENGKLQPVQLHPHRQYVNYKDHISEEFNNHMDGAPSFENQPNCVIVPSSVESVHPDIYNGDRYDKNNGVQNSGDVKLYL